ncbi:MAG: pentapeptide repeat-containing protein [Moorea sp. SIO2B7]|nr:pentapeptide repeat-containing protein [Moorena sp. SIO2B7]
MEIKSLTPFDICSLADVLELPLTDAIVVAQPIAQLTIGLLRILSRKKALKRSEGTWLTFQTAYIQALISILEQEYWLRRPWLNRGKLVVNEYADQRLSHLRLQALLKTLRPGKITDIQTEQALCDIGESSLVKQMNNLAIAWLRFNGAEEIEANLLIQRLVHGLPGYLLDIIIDNPLPLAQLQKFFCLGNWSNWQNNQNDGTEATNTSVSTTELSFERTREFYRAELLKSLSEPFMGEHFALKDIYVPLKGMLINSNREQLVKKQQAVDLMELANSQLDDPSSIALIESKSGFGKTSFCQIWASWIAEKLYPRWMPILINLRDVTLRATFEQTLESALPLGRFSDQDGWFSPMAPPCLIILDGLDQLSPSPQSSRSPALTLIDQIMEFHYQYLSSNSPKRHKIILTRNISSHEIDPSHRFLIQRTYEGSNRRYRLSNLFPLQTKLQRILILPMDQLELKTWFQKWSKLQSKSIAQEYFSFLKNRGIFQKRPELKKISDFLLSPLMLYLLGILHRDGLLDQQLFTLSLPELKLEIYDRIICWVLGESLSRHNWLPELVREGFVHACRSSEAIANLLAGRNPEQLRSSMQQIALNLLQTGRIGKKYEFKKIKDNSKQEENTPIQDLMPLPALLFHSLPLSQKNRKISPYLASPITFSHSQLGFYLGAEEIAKNLKFISQQYLNSYGNFTWIIDSSKVVGEHLYQLLGSGLLSLEIEQLVIERLRQEENNNSHNFSFQRLFERLYPFYQDYCQGRWLDEGIAHQVINLFQSETYSLNTLQIEAAVGINIFSLLCLTAKEASIPFSPCGNPNQSEEFDANRLLTFLNRSAILFPIKFLSQVRDCFKKLHLEGACLNQTVLAGVNLEGSNLSIAELIGTNLTSANLKEANLSWASLAYANLSNSNLSKANLKGADLSNANLLGATLGGANFKNTCLFQAQLDPDTKKMARENGAIFSWEEFEKYNQSLLTASQNNEFPDVESLNTNPELDIQSAEGEPILSSLWYDDTFGKEAEDDGEDKTLLVENYPPKPSPFSRNEDDQDDDSTVLLE